jgi:hypothetical protein
MERSNSNRKIVIVDRVDRLPQYSHVLPLYHNAIVLKLLVKLFQFVSVK